MRPPARVANNKHQQVKDDREDNIMLEDEITALADRIEASDADHGPRAIDAMTVDWAPEMASTHPCCPHTKTTANCAPPTPRPGTIQNCGFPQQRR